MHAYQVTGIWRFFAFVMVEVAGLAFGYDAPLGHLETLQLHGPGLTAVIGRNGSGKSTLLHTLAGLLPALEGRISLDNTDSTQLSAQARATKLAIVLTHPIRLGGLTAREVVELGRLPHGDTNAEVVEAALERLGIAHLANKPMDAVSDGERQKVSIARALAQDTPILMLDEPTAFLDFEARTAMMHVLEQEAQHRCVVFSTHDLHLLQDRPVNVLEVASSGTQWYAGADAQARLQALVQQA